MAADLKDPDTADQYAAILIPSKENDKDNFFTDAARMELSKKVEVVHDPEITALGSKFRHKVSVAVHLKDSKIEQETREQPRGGEDAFAPASDIIEKFKKLSRATMSESRQADLIDMIMNMENVPDMRALPEALRTA